MKRYLQLICVMVMALTSYGQKMKIAQAEYYFNEYKYSNATEIYKELIQKDGLLVVEFDTLYRHAAYSAERAKDYDFSFLVYNSLFQSEKGNFDDAYNLFRISLFLDDYVTAKKVLTSPIVKTSEDKRQIILSAYRDGEVWDDLKKVGINDKVNLVDFNSGLGDFATSWHPKGLVISSGRFPTGAKWEQDNSSFLNSYLYNDTQKNVSILGIIQHKNHDGTAYFDSIKNQWYYSKNYPVENGGYSKTGLYIFDANTKKDLAFSFNSKDYFVAQPYLSADGKVLWFSSNMPGGYGKSDLWYSLWQDTCWSSPINAGSVINSSEDEMFPVLNGRRLYFSSNGHAGFGGLDIFKTKLINNQADKIENLGVVVNSNNDDFSLLLDQSGYKGYLSSNRNGFVDNIYIAILVPVNFLYDAKLKLDIPSTKPIDQIPVYISKNNTVIDTVYADKDGHFVFIGEEENDYKIEINDPKFQAVTDLFSTIGKTESDTVYRELNLKSKYIPFNSTVIDDKSNEPLANSDVFIVNKITGEQISLQTDDNGNVNTELLRGNDYEIIATKQGFIKNTKYISTSNTAEKLVESIALKKISKGVKFEVENVLYDFGKATLRPESMVELNKIVVFLNENPSIKIELSSHTDSRGSDQSNLVLSQKRAQSCVDYLISQGIPSSRIIAKGYGESQLLNDCKNNVICDEAEHQKNRRTEIKVLSVQQ